MKIVFWITTSLLAFGMLGSGLANVSGVEAVAEALRHLGFPPYFGAILGTWKILGAITLVLPGFRRLKEWAYAGFTFTASGAVFAHVASGDGLSESLPAFGLLLLTLVSWATRPRTRKLPSF